MPSPKFTLPPHPRTNILGVFSTPFFTSQPPSVLWENLDGSSSNSVLSVRTLHLSPAKPIQLLSLFPLRLFSTSAQMNHFKLKVNNVAAPPLLNTLPCFLISKQNPESSTVRTPATLEFFSTLLLRAFSGLLSLGCTRHAPCHRPLRFLACFPLSVHRVLPIPVFPPCTPSKKSSWVPSQKLQHAPTHCHDTPFP